ncbi:MAG: hypothetical protein ACRD1M_16105 [Terriglobales bacterium]
MGDQQPVLGGRLRAGQLMSRGPVSPRLLAAATSALACCFGWAAWLGFVTQPQRTSGLSAVLEAVIAVALLQIARGPGADVERLGLMFAAATMALGAFRSLAIGFNDATLLAESALSALSALLLAIASVQRLRRDRWKRAGG